jgi:hypothetical protein
MTTLGERRGPTGLYSKQNEKTRDGTEVAFNTQTRKCALQCSALSASRQTSTRRAYRLVVRGEKHKRNGENHAEGT